MRTLMYAKLQEIKRLNDFELLKLLFGDGKNNYGFKNLLSKMDFNLSQLSELTPKDFIGLGKNIPKNTSKKIAAFLELKNRIDISEMPDNIMIKSPSDTFSCLAKRIQNENVEHLLVMFLRRDNSVIDIIELSKGGMNSTIVSANSIAKLALNYECSGVIMCHNHPSGNLEASLSDRNITKSIKKALALIEVNLLDHVIVSKKGYYSFIEEGLI